MIRDHLFVITALRPWDATHPGATQRLASAIAVENSVLWVNPPPSPEELVALRRDGRPRPDACEQVLARLNPSVWVLHPPIMLPSLRDIRAPALFDRANASNNEHYALVVRWALAHLQQERFYLLSDDPLRSVNMDALLRPAASLFWLHPGAAWSEAWNGTLRSHATRLAARALCGSDVVLAASASLASAARRHNLDTYEIGLPGDGLWEWSRCADRLYASLALTVGPDPETEPAEEALVS